MIHGRTHFGREFDVAELSLAVCRAVQYWNEDLPSIGGQYHFSTQNFPSRSMWCKGAAAELYRSIAEWHRANQLQEQAAGIAVDDHNKSQEYDQAAERLWAEYRAWVRSKKVAINMGSGEDIILSDYSRRTNWNTY